MTTHLLALVAGALLGWLAGWFILAPLLEGTA